MAEKTLEERILLRQAQMETVRNPYEVGMWSDISRFINQRRKDITLNSATNNKGKNLGTSIYDGTPLGALNIWADGMQGLLLSGRWFRSELDNPLSNKIDRVREWLQVYDLKMYSAFDRGNFYAMMPQWIRDGGSIGTATTFTEEVIGTGKISHIPIHPREVFISENEFEEVDTWHRKFMMTARKAFKKFGDKVSDQIKRDAEEHPEKTYEIIHAVFPNGDRVYGKRTAINKAFRSVYMESKTGDDGKVIGQVVRDSGFDVSPYTTWRFRKNSDEVYGRSPAADALTEVFSLNQMSKTLLDAAHQSVSPPRNIPIEMRGRVRMTPDGNNYYDDPKRVITTINSGINYPIGAEERKEVRDSMNDKFRVKFFNAFIGRTGEATREEILAIKGEQAGLLIAQVDTMYIEGIRSFFDIVSDIEDRRGVFTEEAGMPPMPDEIRESGRINFVLIGPLAQAIEEIRTMEPIRKTLGNLSEAATVLGPEMLDVVNRDELSEIIVEAGSYPTIAMNSRTKRQELRDARAAERQRLEQQQMLVEAGKSPNLLKAPEPGSAGEVLQEAVV